MLGSHKQFGPAETDATCPRKSESNFGLHDTLHFPTRPIMFEDLLSGKTQRNHHRDF